MSLFDYTFFSPHFMARCRDRTEPRGSTRLAPLSRGKFTEPWSVYCHRFASIIIIGLPLKIMHVYSSSIVHGEFSWLFPSFCRAASHNKNRVFIHEPTPEKGTIVQGVQTHVWLKEKQRSNWKLRPCKIRASCDFCIIFLLQPIERYENWKWHLIQISSKVSEKKNPSKLKQSWAVVHLEKYLIVFHANSASFA